MERIKFYSVLFILTLSMPFAVIGQWNVLNHPSKNHITNVNYLNQNNIVISGADGLIKSFDGGVSWRIDELISIDNQLYLGSVAYELSYITDDEVFLNGIIYTNNDALILKSTNGGNNWGMKYWVRNGKWPRKFNQVKQINGIYFALGSNGMVLRSTNKGETWAARPVFGKHNLVDFEMLNEETIVTVFKEGIGRSTNGGFTWEIQDFQGIDFRTIAKVNSSKLVAGADGAVFISEDGVNGGVYSSPDGYNWGVENLPDTNNYVGINF